VATPSGPSMPTLDIQRGPFALESGALCSGLYENKLPEVREPECAVRKDEVRSVDRVSVRIAQTGLYHAKRYRNRAQRTATGCFLAAPEYTPSQHVGVLVGHRACDFQRGYRHVGLAWAHFHCERREFILDDVASPRLGARGRIQARSPGRINMGIKRYR
jgi:hypothetical protein